MNGVTENFLQPVSATENKCSEILADGYFLSKLQFKWLT